MRKARLLPVLVAAALAAPGAALAQSSVTISGKLLLTFGQVKVSNFTAPAGANSKETIVKDDASRIIFSVREDLGGGLAAIGRFELRAAPDSGTVANSGESYAGLTSASWGTLTLGRHDLHHGGHASFTGVHGGQMTNPTALFDVAAAGATVIATQSRIPNLVRYLSPRLGGMFEVVVAYSANPSSAAGASTVGLAEADLRSATRRGSAWNVAPKLSGSNWEAWYSYWVQKPDAAAVKMRGDTLGGWYRWSGLRAGLAWNKSKIDAGAGLGVTSNRTAWGIPVSYQTGAHNFYLDWFKARGDRAAALAALDTRANLIGLTYGYDLSKRTTAALSYVRINNGSGAAYNLYTAAAPGTAAAGGSLAVAAGEDPRLWGVSLQHRF